MMLNVQQFVLTLMKWSINIFFIVIAKRLPSLPDKEQDEIGKSQETLKLRLQLKEKDKQIEDLKQRLKGN